jgi:hypothetical protein
VERRFTMDTTDRRMLWTAGLASSVVVLALFVALVVAAASGGYCW